MEKCKHGKGCYYALSYTLVDIAEEPFMVNQLKPVLEYFAVKMQASMSKQEGPFTRM